MAGGSGDMSNQKQNGYDVWDAKRKWSDTTAVGNEQAKKARCKQRGLDHPTDTEYLDKKLMEYWGDDNYIHPQQHVR